MGNAVKLIGLDFGTTSSSAVIASAQLLHNRVSGRTELSQVQECYRSDIVFTPLRDDRIDEAKVKDYLDTWLAAGEVRPEELFGGGALLTGLTAQKDNAASLLRLIRQRLGDALIATADDPCLESWLAFMGSCADLSRAHSHRLICNLDIGGGTTNLALGQAGEVLRTGCLFVGARHIQVVPGTYRMVKLSSYARALLDRLGIDKQVGASLSEPEVHAVLEFYLRLIQGSLAGTSDVFEDPIARQHQQVPLPMQREGKQVVVTLSGGVGELVYAHREGQSWPTTTAFGDLGIDLARRIVDSGLWADDLKTFVPSGRGRATVYGLLRHATHISGSTVFLADPEILPLTDLPILGSVSTTSTDAEIRSLVNLVRRSPQGGCIRIMLALPNAATVGELGKRIAQVLRDERFPPRHPLVLFVAENLGKVLGNYVTAWGKSPLQLVVVDELTVPDAQYARIGRVQNQVLPISFFGLHERGNKP